MKYSKYQENIFSAIKDTDKSYVIEAVAGCLSADTVVGLNRSKKSYNETIKNLVYMFNGGKRSGRGYTPTIETKIRSFSEKENIITLSVVESAIESGIKTTFIVTTVSGNSVRATADHKFLTSVGWKRLSELTINDYLFVDAGKGDQKPHSKKPNYKRVAGMKNHPYHHKSFPNFCVWTHRLVAEANLNSLSYATFVKRIKENNIKGLVFLDPQKVVVHHLDENSLNNKIDNLKVMSYENHALLHANKDQWRNVQARVVPSKIKEIKLYGKEETFDLSIKMEGEPNFLANGIVVHNSGKTSTIIKSLEYVSSFSKSMFIAFNKSIVRELNVKLPEHVSASTWHSLGLKNIIRTFGKVKVDESKTYNIFKNLKGEYGTWSGINRLVSLAKAEGEENPNFSEIFNSYGIVIEADKINYSFLMADRIFRDSLKDTQTVDFDDMLLFNAIGYISSFETFTHLFVDEGQDTNNAQIKMLLSSLGDNGRAIVVGDRKQCVIDNTEILVYDETKKESYTMLIQDVTTKDKVLTATGNGNICPGTITNKYSRRVENKPIVTVVTKSGKRLTTTPEHVYFSDFVEPKDKRFFVYLMQKGDWFRIGRTSTYDNDQYSSHPGFKTRGNQEDADYLWVLEVCDTLEEATYWETFYSIKYGIPQWIFRKTLDSYNLSYNTDMLARLYSEINTKENAYRLLEDKNYEVSRPHYVPKCTNKNRRRNFSITLCGDSRSKTSTLHRYSVSGNDADDEEKLRDLGLNIRKAKNNKGWRLESSTKDMGKIYKLLSSVEQSIGEVNVIEKASLGNTFVPNLRYFPASQLLPGMFVFVENNGEIILDEIVEVSKDLYTGNVYDLDIETTHNYIANGIVVHNSIYRFRGADSLAMDRILTEISGENLPLSICYRCGKKIVNLAKTLVPQIEPFEESPDGAVYYIDTEELLTITTNGDMILCRTNAPLVSTCLQLIGQGKKATVRGRDIGKNLRVLIKKTKEKYPLINDLPDLLLYLSTYVREESFKLSAMERHQAIATLNDQKETIYALATGCDTEDDLYSRMDSIFSDHITPIVLSSIHRAKGLESDRVFIIKPELLPHPAAKTPEEIKEENNIKYVAITRAKLSLFFVQDY